MVNTSITLTCDGCHRYLKDANQIVIEFGDLSPLLAAAEERGWLLEWASFADEAKPARLRVLLADAEKQGWHQVLSTDEGEPAQSLCPGCAKKESDDRGGA